MPHDLYDSDTLIWSEQQAGLLRRLAAGERVNDAIDWTNVVEEIEDVGRSLLRSVETLLRRALLHLVKLASGADRPAAHWRIETAGFLADAQARFSPSVRQRIDLDALYARAQHQFAAGQVQRQGTRSIAQCPFTLDELLAEDVDIAALVARLQAAP